MRSRERPRTLGPEASVGVPILLVGSALALAPALMPEGYSWLTHTTSESAAQGVRGAWLARLGFMLLGLAVLWLCVALATVWAPGATWLHGAFAVFMLATAAFSTRSWVRGAPFDPAEDFLHSLAATAMGFAFAFGVLARLLQRARTRARGRPLDALAISAATLVPLIMQWLAPLEGLLQRLMFAIAYLWYGVESHAARGGRRDCI